MFLPSEIRADLLDGIRSEPRRLWFIDRYSAGRLNHLHHHTQARRAFLATIDACTEAGVIAVVWGGRDCDGIEYSGNVALISLANEGSWGCDAGDQPYPTLRAAVQAHIDHVYEWADGPCGYVLMRPSDAAQLHATSRDLALEAFENGHPYSLNPFGD